MFFPKSLVALFAAGTLVAAHTPNAGDVPKLRARALPDKPDGYSFSGGLGVMNTAGSGLNNIPFSSYSTPVKWKNGTVPSICYDYAVNDHQRPNCNQYDI